MCSNVVLACADGEVENTQTEVEKAVQDFEDVCARLHKPYMGSARTLEPFKIHVHWMQRLPSPLLRPGRAAARPPLQVPVTHTSVPQGKASSTAGADVYCVGSVVPGRCAFWGTNLLACFSLAALRAVVYCAACADR